MLRSKVAQVVRSGALNRPFGLVRLQLRSVADVSLERYGKVYGAKPGSLNRPLDSFPRRHLGPSPENVEYMLKSMDYKGLNSFVEALVPSNILKKRSLELEAPVKGFGEQEMLEHMAKIYIKWPRKKF